MFNNILAMVTQGVDLSLLQKQASHQSPESFCSLEKANDMSEKKLARYTMFVVHVVSCAS